MPKRDGYVPEEGWPPTRLVGTIVLLAATAAGIFLCYRLAVPFLPVLTWALVLAILFAPVHRAIETVSKRPNLAALVSVLLVAIAIVAPLAFVARRLFTEAANGAVMVQAQFEAGTWRHVLQEHPQLAEIDKWIEEQIDVSAIIRNVAVWLTNMAASFVRGSVVQLLGLLLTFYFLFYSLRDRRVAMATLREIVPLSAPELDRLFGRVVDTIHATVYGILVVAGMQGTLGGLMFWWLGLPAPLLWGFIMGLLSIVPVLGAFVVWIPTATYLALDGDWTRASILAAWGALVVGHIDNILRPILVGDRLKLHPVPLFVSFLGGLSLFGAAGLVLGPMMVTTTLTLLGIWGLRRTDNPA